MNIYSIFPEWNLQEEADDTCQHCKIEIPGKLHFIEPIFIGDRYVDLCPECARNLRNLFLGWPKKAMFPGDEANYLYNRFISWKIQEGE